MLKAIFLELIPYIIQENKIFQKAWKETLTNDYQKLINDETLVGLFSDNLAEPEVQEKFRDILKNKKVCDEIIRNYKINHAQIETYVFQTFTFSDPILHLIEDAKNNQCQIILMTWHGQYWKKIEERVKFSNVEAMILSEKQLVTAKTLYDFCTKKNIAVDEFLCITQVEKTINDLVKNNYFCATISALKSTNNNPYIISSLNDLHFENIVYNFYENVDDQSEDL